VRQAAIDQPCPECDTQSKRIVSRDFAAFTFRDGYPRRIPDDGSYYHMGQRVSRAITHSGDGYTHPELADHEPVRSPEVEEIEKFEALQEAKSREDKQIVGRIVDDTVREEARIRRRLKTTKGTPAQERAKQGALKAERELTTKKAVLEDPS